MKWTLGLCHFYSFYDELTDHSVKKLFLLKSFGGQLYVYTYLICQCFSDTFVCITRKYFLMLRHDTIWTIDGRNSSSLLNSCTCQYIGCDSISYKFCINLSEFHKIFRVKWKYLWCYYIILKMLQILKKPFLISMYKHV